ncbi:hypothetical protein H3005_05040 [Stenotrophomonas sp. Br8]|uniref:YobI family P-loop NTPase n=1 Tax=Stenotrophomonas sp. Br8 TaxID=2759658 RepID=UPI00168B5B01|nr:hypothetical protein [Stenotrophomonas sp. Br8]MBD3681227.1 hypothetical protein [Stenotrophomonas sp. Br8]
MTAPAYQFRQRLKGAWLHILAATRAFKRLPSEEQGLETLTPVLLEPAQSRRYEQEMARAMTNPHVRNIAITGGYGAGKSSLIRTFKENHRGFTYASVSLATFRKDGIVAESADEAEMPPLGSARSKAQKSADEDVRLLIDRIEETIVQQLLYSVPATSLPRTRLKRIIQPSRYRAWLTTFCLSLAILAGARLYLFGANPPKNLTLNWLATKLAWLPPSWALAMVFAAAVWIVYQLVRSMSLLNIDGWSIKGGKIESLQHSSVLHKNVDEIIYCFQSSNIDVVIIEDLDRFGIQDVFFRLREINAIVNESPQIKRDIRFIYALNDELFAGSEKTKFFDVVLPVVPVINKENSHAKMIELLGQRILDGKSFAQRIDDELVETVSYRVDDMRLVKNIVNELDIFANILATDLPLAWNKLFALIVVKNLHSDQYWQLSKRTGFLYELISGYSSWRNKCSEELRLKIAEIERLQARKIKDAATSRSELRACVWYHAQLHANSHNASHIHWNGNHVSFMEFLEDGRFTELATASQTMQFVASGSRTGQRFHMPSVLLETNYLERLGVVEADNGELQSQIAATHEALRDLHKLPLSDALRGGYQEEYTKELSENETIRYLLVAGHLDEDYADYL